MDRQSTEKSTKKSTDSQGAPAHRLLERRFVTEWNRPDWVVMGASVAGGLLLGAASYTTWVATSQAADYRNFLYLGALAAAGLFVFRITSGKTVAFVGDAGVAIEQGEDRTRLLWSEIESIRYAAGHLVLTGATTTLRLPSQVHTRAIRAILAEAATRLPKILDVRAKLVDELPEVPGDGPKSEAVESLQIAGKRCVVTKQILTFERDARLCPVCTSVYHRDHVPAECVTCQRPLGDTAAAVGD
jgi:hypothetical protein